MKPKRVPIAFVWTSPRRKKRFFCEPRQNRLSGRTRDTDVVSTKRDFLMKIATVDSFETCPFAWVYSLKSFFFFLFYHNINSNFASFFSNYGKHFHFHPTRNIWVIVSGYADATIIIVITRDYDPVHETCWKSKTERA